MCVSWLSFPLPFYTLGRGFFLHRKIAVFYSCCCKGHVKITSVLDLEVTYAAGESYMMQSLGIITKSQWISYRCDLYLSGDQWRGNQERAKAAPRIIQVLETIQSTCSSGKKLWVLLNSLDSSCISLRVLGPLNCSDSCLLKTTWCGAMGVDLCVQPLSFDPQPPKGLPRRCSPTLIVYTFNRRADTYLQRSSETFLSQTLWGN